MMQRWSQSESPDVNWPSYVGYYIGISPVAKLDHLVCALCLSCK